MKKFLVISLFLVACGGSKKSSTDPNTSVSSGSGTATTPTGDGTPCAQEIALVCPDGQIDGCLKTPQEGMTHACVAK